MILARPRPRRGTGLRGEGRGGEGRQVRIPGAQLAVVISRLQGEARGAYAALPAGRWWRTCGADARGLYTRGPGPRCAEPPRRSPRAQCDRCSVVCVGLDREVSSSR